jgi:hypothetical protein
MTVTMLTNCAATFRQWLPIALTCAVAFAAMILLEWRFPGAVFLLFGVYWLVGAPIGILLSRRSRRQALCEAAEEARCRCEWKCYRCGDYYGNESQFIRYRKSSDPRHCISICSNCKYLACFDVSGNFLHGGDTEDQTAI